jgi:hypothetical protein
VAIRGSLSPRSPFTLGWSEHTSPVSMCCLQEIDNILVPLAASAAAWMVLR